MFQKINPVGSPFVSFFVVTPSDKKFNFNPIALGISQ
jgi:hypothetical protein